VVVVHRYLFFFLFIYCFLENDAFKCTSHLQSCLQVVLSLYYKSDGFLCLFQPEGKVVLYNYGDDKYFKINDLQK
jgi:hypothetical protein